jgi:hypothetical protein
MLHDRTNKAEFMSHNSSPVQDEMTVNMAIRGANSQAVRVVKHVSQISKEHDTILSETTD